VVLDLAVDGLLCILHHSGLHRDDPWGFKRFRNRNDLYRSLGSRFEELDTLRIIMSPATDSIPPIWKVAVFEPIGPLMLIILLISRKSIGSGAGAVSRIELQGRYISFNTGV
jgi:hypothetical protein